MRLVHAACSPMPSSACLVALKANVDRLFAPGEAIGFSPPGAPADRASSVKRFGDIMGRNVVPPVEARLAVMGRDASSKPPLASCGPYALVPGR